MGGRIEAEAIPLLLVFLSGIGETWGSDFSGEVQSCICNVDRLLELVAFEVLFGRRRHKSSDIPSKRNLRNS